MTDDKVRGDTVRSDTVRREFAMPDVGEGLTEAEVVTWHVAVGEQVTVNQIIVEIETAKAAVELPCPYAGTVGDLLVEPGQTVEVGTPIIVIETADVSGALRRAAETSQQGEAAPTGSQQGDTAPIDRVGEDTGAKIGEAGKDGRIATLVGYGPRPGSVARRPRRPPGLQESHVAATSLQRRGFPATAAAPAGAAASRPVPLAKPPVRKLARDLGVDLRTVTPTGAGGVITREDVENHLPAAAPAAAPAAESQQGGFTPAQPQQSHLAAVGGVRREAIRGVRRATAAAMVSSAFTAPHVTEFLAVDVTATMALRDRLRATRPYAEVKLTPLAFVAKAVCLAARRTPELNASWDDAAGEIVYYERVQLGIAAATPRGLIVPKVRDADTLALPELARELGELTATARSGKTPPADLVGGTFTITNVGVFGVDTGTPIINPGEAAILAVGAIKPTPWVVDGELAVRTVCQLALSFDHRLVDGEQGSRFLAEVGALLTDPGLALTW